MRMPSTYVSTHRALIFGLTKSMATFNEQTGIWHSSNKIDGVLIDYYFLRLAYYTIYGI